MTQPTNSPPHLSSSLAINQTEEGTAGKKRSSLDTLSSNSTPAPLKERMSKIAKGSIGEDAITNGSHLAGTSHRSHSQPLNPAPFSLSQIVNLGSRSAPFNRILNYLDLSDMISLRKTAGRFREAIQPTDIPFIYKQQLERRKGVNESELVKYKNLSFQDLCSEKIEFLLIDVCNSYLEEKDRLLIAQNLSNLKKIKLAFVDIDDFTFKRLISCSENLEDLEILFQNISDETLNEATKGGSKLKRLSIHNCAKITNQGLIAAVQNSPNLEHLSLTASEHFTDEVFTQFAQSNRHLTSLAIEECTQITDQGMIAFTQRHRNLKSLSICNCPMITNRGLLGAVQNVPNLEHLTLAISQNFTDDGLIQLAQSNRRLKSLVLNACDQISDLGIVALAQNQLNLESLTIRDCENFTNQGFVSLARNCSTLQYLCIAQSSQITDDAFVELAKFRTNLNSVELRFLSNISDQALIHLPIACPRLTSVRIKANRYYVTPPPADGILKTFGNSSQFSERGLMGLVENGSNLKYIKIEDLPKITQETISKIYQAYPSRTIEIDR